MAADAQVTLSGSVVDPSGAAVANARVSLTSRSQPVPVAAITDDAGHFQIAGLTPGRFELVVNSGDTFHVLRRTVEVTATTAPLVLRLSLPAVEESVDVTADSVKPSLDTAANLDTTTISGAALDMLPVFDQDVIGALSAFLDPGTISTGGTTIIVDGVEMKSAGVPKSAIQEIAINDDPYSAEYNRPGRGRIEIMTKPGSGQLHGSVGFTFRSASLATRNYFASSKAPEQRRSIEGLVSGPLGKGDNSSFLFTFSTQNDDASTAVHALTSQGAFNQNVATPSTRQELMARVTHDWNERQRGSFQLNWKRSSDLAQGVGGLVLPQAGVNSISREDDVLFTLRSMLSPHRLNQFQLTLEFDHEPTSSISAAPGIIVRDAFISGGAQATLLKTESGGKLNDIMTVSRGTHVYRFGVQVPNLNRRVFVDQTNQAGTFTFNTLEDYAAGRPYSFTVQQGGGRASFWWREYGAFFQDAIKLGSNLQAAVGVRYDWQCCFHDSNNFSPRVSVAWSPKSASKTVVRGGGGVFYDRSGVAPIASLLLHNGQRLRSYTILNPSYPDALAGRDLSGIPVNITELAPDIQIPYSVQYSLGVEREITSAASLVIGYRGWHTHHMLRSMDVNAPLPPDYSQIPQPGFGHIQQFRSDGSAKSDALEMTLRGRAGKHVNGQIQYMLSKTLNDTGGIFWYPSNQYAPARDEWGAADIDQRHRLTALLTIKAGAWVNVGVSGRYRSKGPYSETAGVDLFHTALTNARPAGVGRNTLRGPSFSTVDLRWSHDVPLTGSAKEDAPALTVSLDAFNIFNHPSFGGYIGNVRSPLFQSPTFATPGRRFQLSAEAKF